MTWLLVGRCLRLGFFLRVPLLTLLLLAALGPISQFTSASSLLANLFDQQNDAGAIWGGVFAVSFAAFLLAFTAVTAINLTLHYGSLRFSDSPDAAPAGGRFSKHFFVEQKRPGLTFSLGTLAACVLITTVVGCTGLDHFWTSVSAGIAAFALAIGLTLLAKIVQLAMTDPNVTEHPPPLLVFPAYRLRWLEAWFDKIYSWPRPQTQSHGAALVRGLKSTLSTVSRKPFQLVGGASQGYLATVTSPEGERLKLRSGHVFALTLATIALATYIIVGFNKSNISAEPAAVPALAYLLLFLIVGCWILSALAFFFDRYRFPLLLSVILLAMSTAFVPQSDHFFRVETADSVKKLQTLDVNRYLSPAEYLDQRTKDPKQRRLILVATPGGGIQAAAWTAKVLQELDARFKGSDQSASFRDSVGLISSVSGGSLGSMIYAASYAGTVREDCVAENARASAIDEVAWGLTSPDFWRMIFPSLRRPVTIDRGWALEQKWAVVNGLSRGPSSTNSGADSAQPCVGRNPGTSASSLEDDTYLSDWAAKGVQPPALIFNSMILERGQHVVFSTTRFPAKDDPRGIGNFYDLFPDVGKPFDIRVNTAARLSASFPYVAPAARSNLRAASKPDFHFVDGGYYDNLGIDSLIGWTASAYGHNPDLLKSVPEVLVVQIRHFNPDGLAHGSRAGWGFQLTAPLMALLHMWNNSPTHRDRNELDLFIEDCLRSGSGPKIKVVTIPYCGLDYGKHVDTQQALRVCFAAAAAEPIKLLPHGLQVRVTNRSRKSGTNCADPPLSWKLTASQKNCIDDTWDDFVRNDPNGVLETMQKFLGQGVSAKESGSATALSRR